MDLCAILTGLSEVLEKAAPLTPNKYDDIGLLVVRIAKAKACPSDGPFAAADAGVESETYAKAEALADEFLAKCDCDDCEC